MKPKLFDKILLALLLIVVIAVALALIGMAAGFISAHMVDSVLSYPYTGPVGALMTGVIGLLLLIIAIRLLFFGVSGQKQSALSAALIRASEVGTTYIALAALDDMAQRFCKSQKQIRECVTAIGASAQGINVNIKIALMPETNIPEFTDELSHSLKEHIEKYSGIQVTDVRILVVNPSHQAAQQPAIS